MSETHNRVAARLRCHSALHESSLPHELNIFCDIYTSCTFRPVYSLRWVSYGSGLAITVAKRNICTSRAGDRTQFLLLASGHTCVPVGKVGRTERGFASAVGSGSGVQRACLM
jgi:hypothetical protein